MSLDNSQLQFLWHLFRLFLLDKKSDASQWVAAMYERCPNLPESIESFLLEFWKNGSESAVLGAALFATRQFYFDPERQVILVSVLVERKLLSIGEAVQLLTFQGIVLDKFPVSIRRVIDLVWLINQDQKDGVMTPQQDMLIENALRDVSDEAGKLLEST